MTMVRCSHRHTSAQSDNVGHAARMAASACGTGPFGSAAPCPCGIFTVGNAEENDA